MVPPIIHHLLVLGDEASRDLPEISRDHANRRFHFVDSAEAALDVLIRFNPELTVSFWSDDNAREITNILVRGKHLKCPLMLIAENINLIELPNHVGLLDFCPPLEHLVEARIENHLKLREQNQLIKLQQREVLEARERLEREIRYHRETEQILRENERTLRSIFRSIEASGEGILITDKTETVYYVNPAFTKITGYEEDEVFGCKADDYFHVEDSPLTFNDMKIITKTTGTWRGDVTLSRKNGSRYEAYLDINSVKDVDGNFEGYIFLQQDITTKKRIMVELERLARVDSLTGLYNRRYFMERLRFELNRSKRYRSPLTLLMVDLDHFKHINDTYGHVFGDRVLEHIGQLIDQLMRNSDIAGRYGGEELIIALPNTPLSGGKVFAERLRTYLNQKEFTVIDGRKFRVTCSIGIACYREEIGSMDHFFSLADEALYDAKKNGRNRIEVRE